MKFITNSQPKTGETHDQANYKYINPKRNKRGSSELHKLSN